MSAGAVFPVQGFTLPAYPIHIAIEDDSTQVTVRKPPEQWLDTYLDNPDYQYHQEDAAGVTWWDQLQQWFWNLLARLFEENQQDRVWNNFFKILAVLLVIFAVLRFLKMDVQHLFNPKQRGSTVLLHNELEDLRETDFKVLAEEALRQGQSREAARLYYMHVLKHLDTKGAIDWRPQKTNQDYVSECRLVAFRPAFSRLTYLFDYLWYGDFPVEQRYVEEMRSLALSLDQTSVMKP